MGTQHDRGSQTDVEEADGHASPVSPHHRPNDARGGDEHGGAAQTGQRHTGYQLREPLRSGEQHHRQRRYGETADEDVVRRPTQRDHHDQ